MVHEGSKRRHARRKEWGGCDGLPIYDVQLRSGPREGNRGRGGLLPWPGGRCIGEVAANICVCVGWLTGEYLVVSLEDGDVESASLSSEERENILRAKPSMDPCEEERCRRQGWHRAASRERYLYH